MGAVVIDDQGRVLLIRRGQEPQMGDWSIPGGAVELGEALEDAVSREVLEETGLQVEIVRLVEALDRILYDGEGRLRYHYVLVDYLCRVKGGAVCCATDALEARWVSLDDLSRAEINLAPVMVEVIRKAFVLNTAINPR